MSSEIYTTPEDIWMNLTDNAQCVAYCFVPATGIVDSVNTRYLELVITDECNLIDGLRELRENGVLVVENIDDEYNLEPEFREYVVNLVEQG